MIVPRIICLNPYAAGSSTYSISYSYDPGSYDKPLTPTYTVPDGPSIQQNGSAESRVSGLVSIHQNGSAKFNANELIPIKQIVSAESNPFMLGWSHYQVLMRIKNDDERRFYEIEAINEQWSYKQLKWHYNSSLYERLALSRDKDEVMRLAREGQTMEKTQDILKNPLVLEFYGLEEKAAYSESDLESAIITNLQEFLLELGKGFLFEARQKRFTFNEKHFKADLVLYNRLLRCYVLIDLKKGELKHQDLGQMQMYVHYFDRRVKTKDENPTVDIALWRKGRCHSRINAARRRKHLRFRIQLVFAG